MNDRYVKVCLTAIVLLLTAILLKPIFSPTAAEAQSWNPIQISAWSEGGFLFYENSTGRLWSYGFTMRNPIYMGRIPGPGMPLIKDGR